MTKKKITPGKKHEATERYNKDLFYGMNGIYPHHLGTQFPTYRSQELLVNRGTFSSIIRQYPMCYKKILGERLVNDCQTDEIIKLLRDSILYAGSDGSVKNGCGAHAYGFTSSNEEG